MSQINTVIFLDTGVLGMLIHPKGAAANLDCNKWLEELVKNGIEVVVPEICDYELRREMVRRKNLESLKRLDDLGRFLRYLPLDTTSMRRACEYWGQARQKGRPGADDKDLDADVILAAQAVLLAELEGWKPIVATTNRRHLELFIDAREWKNVTLL